MDRKISIKFENIIYFLLLIYIILIYMYGGKEQYTYTYKFVMMIICFFEVIQMIKLKKIQINPAILILVLFSGYCCLSSIWAINSQQAFSRGMTLLKLSGFLLILYNCLYYDKNNVEKVLKIIMYAGIIFSIYVILYYGLGNYIQMVISGQRVGAEIDNVNMIGLETSLTFLITVFYGMKNKKYFFLSILPMLVSIGTGSRKVVVIMILGTILILLFGNIDRKNLKKKIINLVKVFAFCLVIFFIVTRFDDISIVKRFTSMLNIFGEGNKVDASTLERISFITAGIEQFIETPILGIGAGNSGHITMKVAGWSTYLHNNYVELLATVGAVGFILFYSIYVYFIFKIYKKRKEVGKFSSLVIILIFLILILDYGAVTYYSKPIFIYLLFFNLLLINRGDKNEQNN